MTESRTCSGTATPAENCRRGYGIGVGGISGTLTLSKRCAVSDGCWTNWKIIGIGDFNQDGIDDLFWQNLSTGAIQMSLLNGSGVVTGDAGSGQEVRTNGWVFHHMEGRRDGGCQSGWNCRFALAEHDNRRTAGLAVERYGSYSGTAITFPGMRRVFGVHAWHDSGWDPARYCAVDHHVRVHWLMLPG